MAQLPELLGADVWHQVLSGLDDKQRLAAACVCTRWAAAIDADSRLWPLRWSKVLRAFSIEIPDPEDLGNLFKSDVKALLFGEHQESRMVMLHEARCLSPALRRLRLEGFKWQADVVASVLALAPTTRLLELELDSMPDGILLSYVLPRFPRLEAVSISTCSEATSWGGEGLMDAGSAVVTKLREVALDLTTCNQRLEHGRLYIEYSVRSIDEEVARGLQAATRLQDLSLALRWSDDVAQLCTSLPALCKLSLDLRSAHTEQLTAAAAMLVQLSRLNDSSLTACTNAGGEKQFYRGQYEPTSQLPALESVTHLTRLVLVGSVALPPDWSQLPALRVLRLRQDKHTASQQWARLAAEPAPRPAGRLRLRSAAMPPSSAAAQLDELQLVAGQFPEQLCSQPAMHRLPRLYLKEADRLPAQFTRLSQLSRLETGPLRTIPQPVCDLTALQELYIAEGLREVPAGPYLQGLQVLWVHKAERKEVDVSYNERGFIMVPAALDSVPGSLAAALHTLRLPLPLELDKASMQLLCQLPSLRDLYTSPEDGEYGDYSYDAWRGMMWEEAEHIEMHAWEEEEEEEEEEDDDNE